jgi:hypothetical protein
MTPPYLRQAFVMVVMDSRSAYSNDRIVMETNETAEDFGERVKQDVLKKLKRFER